MAHQTPKMLSEFIGSYKEQNITIKEARFVVSYFVNGFSLIDAFLDAGFKSKDRSSGCARARKILQKKHVKIAFMKLVDSWLDEKRGKFEAMIIDTYYQQAFYDPADFYNPDGTVAFTSWDQIPKKKRCCVKKLEVKYYGKDADREVVVMELADREKALDKLGKYIQMFNDGKEEEKTLRLSKDTENMLSAVFGGTIKKENEVIDAEAEIVEDSPSDNYIELE